MPPPEEKLPVLVRFRLRFGGDTSDRLRRHLLRRRSTITGDRFECLSLHVGQLDQDRAHAVSSLGIVHPPSRATYVPGRSCTLIHFRCRRLPFGGVPSNYSATVMLGIETSLSACRSSRSGHRSAR
jgi:hypothetical protein